MFSVALFIVIVAAAYKFGNAALDRGFTMLEMALNKPRPPINVNAYMLGWVCVVAAAILLPLPKAILGAMLAYAVFAAYWVMFRSARDGFKLGTRVTIEERT